MARSKGSTSSNKKKATARGRANEKSARGGAGRSGKPSVREMSQGRFPGERPLTGEDRPADRKSDKVQGLSSSPRGRRGVRETTRKGDGRPDPGMGKPSPLGRHNI
jgi:hypothetical protein